MPHTGDAIVHGLPSRARIVVGNHPRSHMNLLHVQTESRNDGVTGESRPHVRSGALTSVSPCHDDFQLTPVNGHLERLSACLERSNNGTASSDVRLQLVSAVHLSPQSDGDGWSEVT